MSTPEKHAVAVAALVCKCCVHTGKCSSSAFGSAVPKSVMCLRESRDPRFDSLSGTLDNDRFRTRYAFLYDEQLPAEREQIKGSLQVVVLSRRWLLCLNWW